MEKFYFDQNKIVALLYCQQDAQSMDIFGVFVRNLGVGLNIMV